MVSQLTKPETVSAFFSGIAVIVAWITIRSAVASQRAGNMINVLMHGNSRFQDIEAIRSSQRQGDANLANLIHGKVIEKDFFSRYWGLRSDQFDYWFSGNMDHAIFCGILMSIVGHFSRGERYYGSYTLYDGWKTFNFAYHKEANPIFTQLIESLYSLASLRSQNSTKISYLDVMRRVERITNIFGDPGTIPPSENQYGMPTNFRAYAKRVGVSHYRYGFMRLKKVRKDDIFSIVDSKD